MIAHWYFKVIASCLVLLAFGVSQAVAQVVALGASNTRGKGVAFSQAYPAQLQSLLRAQGVNVSVRNAGINGNTTGQMLARLASAVPKGTRVVILQPGGNDRRRGVSADQQSANVKEIRQRLAKRGIRVVMLPNSLIRSVAQTHPRPDGQHFLPPGYRALAARLVPQVRAALGR
ncbi:MAG: hypothetical protein RLZ98_2638 [Pseudomonadota bacterium]|jgi:acyl-CoA thioesterase-1